MKILYITVISFFCFLVVPGVNAQIISVKSQLEKDSFMIGDQVVFSIHVEADDNVSIRLPEITDTLSRNIEILFPIASDTSVADGKRVVDHSYMITSFDPGLQMVPAQPVIYSLDDVNDTALSMPLMIQVYEPVVDTTQQIKPIKPPLDTPLSFREVLPWIGVGFTGLLLLTLIVLLIRRYRQRQQNPEKFYFKPQEPAHVIAFRELDKLKAEKVWELGKVKQYYTRLTQITRHYIERQYGIPAMESTTDEILQSFRMSSDEDSLLDEMLKELLELADLVKFAKEDPLPLDNQTNLNNAYLFVQKTYPLFFKVDAEPKEGAKGHE